MPFTLFEKCKWKNNDLRSRSRNESEIKITGNRDREVKVKWKSFEIEIEKWNFSRIFENLKIIPDVLYFGFCTLLEWLIFFMKLGVKFHPFFSREKGEIFSIFTLFDKWKWKINDWKSRSGSESEIKTTRDREVKFQKNSREFSRIETLAGHWGGVQSKNILRVFVE